MANVGEVKMSESVSREERIIASKLFGVRTRMGLEREDLAAMVGINEIDLAEYENGLAAIPASELYLLATAMGISINYFYSDDIRNSANATNEEEATVLQ